ncbi:hypothetical protein JCGZ_06154 [Jatropha curcas]|uniref:Pectate lyase superfamily protein domain-containing protein n=1 Tax=Jatropha curcas TaxID=180498 RepID=A0A067KQ15_JATCU|nr:hypothetical protein JCGZ_06154 [Jatropha curcas]
MSSVISSPINHYNVLSYGAVGDGNEDDTQAFVEAWNAACHCDEDTPRLVVPEDKTFLVNPINFLGPCKSGNIEVVLSGTIIAPDGSNPWMENNVGRWLAFRDVHGLNITGDGMLDGRGERWWDFCKHHRVKSCNRLAPWILGFSNCTDVHMRGINTARSGGGHIFIFGCENVDLAFLNIQAPATSPNTDGDDCISMVDRTYNVNITNVDCGPGHGISIGSLGANGEVVDVQNITIRDINFYGTTNGARIKTCRAGRGRVQDVYFYNINVTEVKNPIIIDQHYGEKKSHSTKMRAGVHISDVQFFGFFGTSKSKVAIDLNCSENVPCTNLSLGNIRLGPAESGEVTSTCNNAFGSTYGVVRPKSCLRYQREKEQKIKEEKENSAEKEKSADFDLYTIFLLIMCKATLQSSKALRSVNVVNFGAVGNGNADDSNAFTKASEAACGATGEASLTVPAQKTFLLKPVKFLGPCKSSQINILVQGNIVAPSKIYQNGQHLIWEGSGFVKKVYYENITLQNTSNPILIDQFYCPEHMVQKFLEILI